MMGRKNRTFAPLVNVSLEHLVPADHFYPHLHTSLNLAFVREWSVSDDATGSWEGISSQGW